MTLSERERLELKKLISKAELSGPAIGIAHLVDSSGSTSELSDKQLAVFDEIVRPAMPQESECLRGGHEIEVDQLRDGKSLCIYCENLHEKMLDE